MPLVPPAIPVVRLMLPESPRAFPVKISMLFDVPTALLNVLISSVDPSVLVIASPELKNLSIALRSIFYEDRYYFGCAE